MIISPLLRRTGDDSKTRQDVSDFFFSSNFSEDLDWGMEGAEFTVLAFFHTLGANF